MRGWGAASCSVPSPARAAGRMSNETRHRVGETSPPEPRTRTWEIERTGVIEHGGPHPTRKKKWMDDQ